MNEQMNASAEQIKELKVKLYDAGEHIEQQAAMLKAISEKAGYVGQSFEELLALIPEGQQEETQEVL